MNNATYVNPSSVVTEFVYLHPPRERQARPQYSAADILGAYGASPTYRGGLKAYSQDRAAHEQYRTWKRTQ